MNQSMGGRGHDPADRVGPASSYAAATESLRTTARWLLTALAGVGGLLVAGLQLTGLGALGDHQLLRLVVALLAVAVTLTGVGFMIWRTSQLLADEWVSLAQLQVEDFELAASTPPSHRAAVRRAALLKSIRDKATVYQDELYADVAGSVSELGNLLAEANRKTRAGQTVQPTLEQLREAAAAVVQFANYHRTRAEFIRLRSDLVWAGVVVVVAVITFAYAANPPG
ncbi:MAG TPA: hypothetical protein VFJ97_07090 [Dermatophilaceae bacterium]|nr:hypothetical protein [Dermatophilaceae bacterium]